MNKIIKARHGEVRGSAVDGVNTFKGIHYVALRAAAALCAILALLLGLAAMLPVVSPKGAHIAINMAATAPKLLGGALAPFVTLFGGLGAALGLLLCWMNRARWRSLSQSKAGWGSKFRLAFGGPVLVLAGVTGAIFHGDVDRSTPVISSRALHQKLKSVGVPSVYVEFPKTDHGFDIILPRLNPATQNSLYDLDRFLALIAGSKNFLPPMP